MNLTARQWAVAVAEGDFLLLACPESGKTRAAAARAGRLIATPGRKVAACSYTNVGVQRLGTLLGREVGAVLGPKHFVGTIHDFLLSYVVYPFAHLLGAEKGPFVREDGGWQDVVIGGDRRKRMSLDRFRRDPAGGLVVTERPPYVREAPSRIVELVGGQVIRHKDGLFERAGLLTADDAMWVALRILREHRGVAAAVAARFDELLLDEAQDTSELQLACLAALRATGKLCSLVLIGDLDQSVYSFQGASAERCRQLADDHGLRQESLTENHRCSQRICDIAAEFSSREHPDKAVGEHADCPIVPEVALYPPQDPPAAIALFRERLAHHGISPREAAALSRRWKVAHALNGDKPPAHVSGRSLKLGRIAAAMAAGRLTYRDVRRAQQLLTECAWDARHPDELTDAQFAAARRETYRFLRALPPLEGDLRAWIKAAAGLLQEAGVALSGTPAHTGGRLLQSSRSHADYQVADVFAPPAADLRAETVHSIKGEDRDAVMLLIHPPHQSDPTSQLELWEATVTGRDIDAEKEEERRVAYVALTRARRYCLVVLPDNHRGRAVADGCASLGFVRGGDA